MGYQWRRTTPHALLVCVWWFYLRTFAGIATQNLPSAMVRHKSANMIIIFLFFILAGNEDNIEQVSSSFMSTTTPSLSALVSATSYSLQSSYSSSASVSRESTTVSTSHLPVLSSSGEAVVTNYETSEQRVMATLY